MNGSSCGNRVEEDHWIPCLWRKEDTNSDRRGGAQKRIVWGKKSLIICRNSSWCQRYWYVSSITIHCVKCCRTSYGEHYGHCKWWFFNEVMMGTTCSPTAGSALLPYVVVFFKLPFAFHHMLIFNILPLVHCFLSLQWHAVRIVWSKNKTHP